MIIPRFTLDDTFNRHNLAIIAYGILKEPYCYYKEYHDNGADMIFVSDVYEIVFVPIDS